MTTVAFIGWRGMVGSVLMERMREERDFDAIEPVFFTTSNVGGAGPAIGKPVPPLKDGNDVAGIRLPPVEAPIATTTGWALRRAGFGENDGCEGSGQYVPFKTIKAERLAAGDPRLSLEERYTNHDGYVAAVTKAAEGLGKQRLLLPADVQQYIEQARASSVLR